MQFYNRTQELANIKTILAKSYKKSQLTVIQGKRRVGKTRLILESLKQEFFLYFFVGRKTSKELLADFQEEIVKKLNIPYLGEFNTFGQLLEFIFTYAKQKHLIIIFDEFQNFKYVNKGVFSELQKYWDLNKDQVKLNILCIGSMFSLIKKIFTNSKEPLYNRATQIINLKSFDLSTQKQILKDFRLLNPYNFLVFFSIFGGVPKYLELLEDEGLENKDLPQIIQTLFCQENAYLLGEGKNVLIAEFGKAYENYFACLTAIAQGKTTKNEIYTYTGISLNSLGVYLKHLEDFYELIERKTPILTKKSSSKLSSYHIKDNFLAFWFRYIYKKSYLIESQNYQALLKYILGDVNNYLGFTFEDLVKQHLIEQNMKVKADQSWEIIGSFWKRAKKEDFDNKEIDLVAINKSQHKVLIGECKLDGNRIEQKTIDNLEEKAKLIQGIKNYHFEYCFFTLYTLSSKKQDLLNRNNFKSLSLEKIIAK